jgi:hypothetical protein
VLKLGEALARWQPDGRGAPREPLAVVRAGWTEIVGPDVARAAQPVALTGSALVVLTSSGAWSHQLAFLERDILRSLAALGVGGIERLRFRVGTIRTPVPGAAPKRVTRARAEPAAGAAPPRSSAEALERLRSVVEAQRAAHVQRGGRFCERCGGRIAQGRRCRPCADEDERAHREGCERIMFEAPWLAAEEVLALVPGLDAAAYDAIRRGLLRRWVDELRLARKRHDAGAPIDAVRVRKLASSYVLLETRISPNRLELDSPVRRNALGDLYAFICAIEQAASTVP